MNIEGNNVYEVWTALLRNLLNAGGRVGPRGRATRELLGVRLHVDNSLANVIVDPTRGLNYRFLVAQWLTAQFGLEDLPTLLRFNKALGAYEEDGQGGRYPSYGPRLRPQWPFLYQAFRRDHLTRQAVMSIWAAQLPGMESRDVPCTLSLQFLLRDTNHGAELHTVATMRSSDAWLGLPYDLYNFTMLGNFLAGFLGGIFRRNISPGTFTLNLGSSHVYEPHWERVLTTATTRHGRALTSQRLPFNFDAQPLPEFLVEERTDLDALRLPQPWRQYALVLTATSQGSALSRLAELEAYHAGH